MRKELLLTNRFVYDQELITDFIRLSKDNDISEFNIPPCLLENFVNSDSLFEKINLTIDFPFSQLDTKSRVMLVSSFEEKFKKVINYYNIGIVPFLLEKNKFAQDIEALPHKEKIRIFLEWSMTKDNDEVYCILDTLQNLGIERVVIGTNYKKIEIDSLITDGFFGFDLKISLFGNLFNKNGDSRFDSILYVPESIFNL